MKNFKVKKFGSNSQGVVITGDRMNQEPEHFIVKLPFGEVEITRTTDDNYWIHVSKKKDELTNEYSGNLSKFRLDENGGNGIYLPEVDGEHLAVLISK